MDSSWPGRREKKLKLRGWFEFDAARRIAAIKSEFDIWPGLFLHSMNLYDDSNLKNVSSFAQKLLTGHRELHGDHRDDHHCRECGGLLARSGERKRALNLRVQVRLYNLKTPASAAFTVPELDARG